MVSRNLKFRKEGADVLVEVSGDTDSPRETTWEHGFECINLTLFTPQLIYRCGVHEREVSFSISDPREKGRLLDPMIPDLSSGYVVRGVIESPEFLNRLAVLGGPDENGVHAVQKLDGDVWVTIESGEATEETEHVPGGIFPGRAIYDDEADNYSGLTFYLRVDSDQLDFLAEGLLRLPKSAVQISAFLLCYISEIDSAFATDVNQLDLIIADMTSCNIQTIDVLGPSQLLGSVADETEHGALPSSGMKTNRANGQEENEGSALAEALGRVSHALWVIAVVLLASLFF